MVCPRIAGTTGVTSEKVELAAIAEQPKSHVKAPRYRKMADVRDAAS
jgi:hypothetical protein